VFRKYPLDDDKGTEDFSTSSQSSHHGISVQSESTKDKNMDIIAS
jgi:hypothetical protein